jgi:hypothetical protein
MNFTLKLILFCLGNMVLFVLLIKLFFKTGKRFKKAIYYLFLPDLFSMIKNDFDNDFRYSGIFWFMMLTFFLLFSVQVLLFF